MLFRVAINEFFKKYSQMFLIFSSDKIFVTDPLNKEHLSTSDTYSDPTVLYYCNNRSIKQHLHTNDNYRGPNDVCYIQVPLKYSSSTRAKSGQRSGIPQYESYAISSTVSKVILTNH